MFPLWISESGILSVSWSSNSLLQGSSNSLIHQISTFDIIAKIQYKKSIFTSYDVSPRNLIVSCAIRLLWSVIALIISRLSSVNTPLFFHQRQDALNGFFFLSNWSTSVLYSGLIISFLSPNLILYKLFGWLIIEFLLLLRRYLPYCSKNILLS